MKFLHDFLHWRALSRVDRGIRESERQAVYARVHPQPVMPRPRTIAQAALRVNLRGGQGPWLSSSLYREASRR